MSKKLHSASESQIIVCSVCNKAPSKYRCPRCDCRSCGLVCIKRHKKESGCSGKRNKSSFVELLDMDDNLISSDYHFVNEVDRGLDSSKRIFSKTFGSQKHSRRSKRGKHHTTDTTSVKLPPRLFHFKKAAISRGIDLRLMPFGMQRRKENTSIFVRKTGTIYWRVQLVFPSAQYGELEYVESRVSEKSTVNDVLALLFDADSIKAPIQHRLKAYMKERETLSVLLTNPGTPANDRQFYSIARDMPLEKCLSGKSLIEFPVFTIILQSEAKNFNIVTTETDISTNEIDVTKEKVVSQLSINK